MLTGIPLLHYFKCKNEYSGSHSGMRYLFTPGKRKLTVLDFRAFAVREVSCRMAD